MSPLTEIKGVGEKTAEKLALLEVDDERQLLLRLPKTYLDFTAFSDLNVAERGDFVLLRVKIIKKAPLSKKTGRNAAVIFADANGITVRLIFFGRDYILSTLKLGVVYRVYGKLAEDGGWRLVNPQLDEDNEKTRLTGIVPVYANKGEIPQNTYRNILKNALQTVRLETADARADEQLTLPAGLSAAHFPKSLEDAERGCKRVMLERVLGELLEYRSARAMLALKKQTVITADNDSVEQWKRSLPFLLNSSQNVAIDTILSKMQETELFRGILSGDVGSGKTVVFLLTAMAVIAGGGQVALMAPTELVAEQHAQTAARFLYQHGARVALLTSSVKGKARTEILTKLKAGQIDLLVGTQSLLSAEVEFAKLMYVGIDEQHRFGVGERDRLLLKAQCADTLMMTATPIPRTYKLLFMGEYQNINLAERAQGRNVKTRIVNAAKYDGMMSYLTENALKGSCSYVICPQVNDTEEYDGLGAEELFGSLKAQFPNVSFGLVTGKMNFQQKTKAVEKFRSGEVKILIATTVVEVGLDVPEADTVVVMHAERFGLSSLHQLRGRVGRAGQEAYCFLYTENKEESERLKLLTSTDSGIEIAEADFRLRGAGELVGMRQHGKDKALSGVTEEILQKAKEIADLKLF